MLPPAPVTLTATTREFASQRTPEKEQWPESEVAVAEVHVERTPAGLENEALRRRSADLSEKGETASFRDAEKRKKTRKRNCVREFHLIAELL